ncbi:MAG: hypothetical protein HY716_10270 [Planctomycetes bacterium]|nr:hypothetical protein [Planctomycetota bacterium]
MKLAEQIHQAKEKELLLARIEARTRARVVLIPSTFSDSSAAPPVTPEAPPIGPLKALDEYIEHSKVIKKRMTVAADKSHLKEFFV